MKVASGLARGLYPTPELAGEAVSVALHTAGLERADSVLLFLTRDYVGDAQPALVAAARAAGTLQVGGCTAYGLLSEHGWLLDQPGAVALVIGENPAATPSAEGAHPLLSFTGQSTLPHAWQSAPARAGLLDPEAVCWAHARVASAPGSEVCLVGLYARLCLSSGLRLLSLPLTVNASNGYELQRVGGLRALASLRHNLPAALHAELPMHQIAILRNGDVPAIPLLASNSDGSLTLGEPLAVGEHIHWALRQPLSAEQDMRSSLTVDGEIRPDFALMFSCLGRGPLFYGHEDRDLLAFRERFPGVPLAGAYGSGQIAPVDGGNRLFQNTVVTLLYESAHV